MKRVAIVTALLCTGALAQPVQPPPARSHPVADALKSAPVVALRNGHIAMTVALPDRERGFFRGTRFDQAGVVTSLMAGGREFYGPWFERTAPEVLDYTYTADGLVAGPDSAASGPVEEFGQIGFENAKPGELFLKIGVGLLRKPDDKPYDKYRHYEIADWGRRSLRTTRDSVTLTQTMTAGPQPYVYEKTLRLVKDRMVIDHVLRNTGATPISTNVYDHNFLRLVPGNNGIRVTFPFTVTAATPLAADLIRLDGRTMTYLRPMADKERVSFTLTGFDASASDYDIDITDTATGAGVRIKGDQPITRINIFSIDRVQAVEPYVAIEVPPGGEKRWSYTYTYAAGH
jgi:hypothetical protein